VCQPKTIQRRVIVTTPIHSVQNQRKCEKLRGNNVDPMLFSLVSSTSQVTSVKYCQHQQWSGIDEYRLFKYDYLPRSIDKSLYDIVVMIVCSFLPDTYQNYLSANLKEQCHHLRIFFVHNRRSFGNRSASIIAIVLGALMNG
jgi:hypothetical protein